MGKAKRDKQRQDPNRYSTLFARITTLFVNLIFNRLLLIFINLYALLRAPLRIFFFAGIIYKKIREKRKREGSNEQSFGRSSEKKKTEKALKKNIINSIQ